MDDDIEQLRDIHELDQDSAAIDDVSKQVASHFMKLRYGCRMSEGSALILTRDFQKYLMVGDDASIVIRGMVEE